MASGGALYSESDSYAFPNTAWDSDSSTTLYAQWQRSTYTISFGPNNGTGTMTPSDVPTGESLTVPTPTFTRDDYWFLYWTTDAAGTSQAYYPGDSFTPSNDEILYAQWTQAPNATGFEDDEEPQVILVLLVLVLTSRFLAWMRKKKNRIKYLS